MLMYIWISEDARDELDKIMKTYENEVKMTQDDLDRKEEDYQKPFYKIKHWKAKLSFEEKYNNNIKAKEKLKLFCKLKASLQYGVSSLDSQYGLDIVSIFDKRVYENLKKCYKMYDRILINLFSNDSLSEEMMNDYVKIGDEMCDFLNHISFRIPKNFKSYRYLSYYKIDMIASFSTVYSIVELALLNDWDYEKFIKVVKVYDYFRNNSSILEDDLSNIDQFSQEELDLIKMNLLNETVELNNDIDKQNEKLNLVRKINNYLVKNEG